MLQYSLRVLVCLGLFTAGCDLGDLNDDLEGAFDVDICGFVSCDAEERFESIATELDGEVFRVDDARDVPERLEDIVRPENYGLDNSDIVFLIDKTGSMKNDIEAVQDGLSDIIATIEAAEGIRLGAGTYGDKITDGNAWFDVVDLTTDYDSIQTYINNINTTGGGDLPESVYDGLVETMNTVTWESSVQRLIIMIGDAEPHTRRNTTNTFNQMISTAQSFDPSIKVVAMVINPLNE